jgi:hypothetical protein
VVKSIEFLEVINIMEKRNGVVWGILLILMGGFFLVTRLMPDLFGVIYWPFIIIGLGLMFLLLAVLTRSGGLAIPGCIIGGIGGIFYWQAMTNHYESWAYIWTLIPGFVGLGVIIASLLDHEHPHFDSGGLVLMAISALGFLVFGSAFGALLGFPFNVNQLWPLFLIGIGVIILISTIFRKR